MNPSDPIKSKRVPRFVEEYAKDRNGTQAAIRAGYTSNADSAGVIAARLLNDVRIQKLIEEQIERVSREAVVEAADVLRQWLDIATADPSKLTRTRRTCCRYCWGEGHKFQWSAREYAEACDKALQNVNPRTGEPAPKPLPDCGGGFGWVFNAEPNPDCPECRGEGVETTYIADIESLSGPERRLFAGIKMTANGPEVKLRDQDAALANIAKYLGMLVEKRELTGKNGAPLGVPAIPPSFPTDPLQVAALYQSLMGGA